jgi:PAS domain S-box-containing protein
LGVFLFFGLLTILIIRYETSILKDFNNDRSSVLATAITRGLEETMLGKKPAGVKDMLMELNQMGDVKVGIFGPDGSPAFGSNGYKVPPEAISSIKEMFIESDRELIFLKPLLNEMSCHGCHNPADRIRGIVAIRASTEKIITIVNSTMWRLIIFGIVVSLLSGAILIFLVRRMILNPLLALHRGAEELKEGNLNYRINIERKDEIGDLAIAFNEMAERIKDSYMHLEETVQSKTTALKTQKEFAEAIFNNMGSGVMVLDPEGYIIKVNRAGSEILRIPQEELIIRRLIEILPQAADFLVVDRSLGREVEVHLADGTVIPVGFTNSILFGENGQKIGTVVIFRDLTEIKKLQSEIRKRQHFEAIGRVISGVAHEIRNPLFGISSIGQILEREIESPQHQALIQAVLKETGRMKRLVDDLLLYSKPSTLSLADVDLGLLMEELAHYVKSKKSEITIALDIPYTFIIKADRDKMMQVFINIFDNAIDVVKSRIDVNVKKEADKTVVTISDDGEGIKQADIEQVFEPFFTTKKGGTGLGLSICKKIVEEHGGSIEVESDEGKGTRVILTFKSG